MKKRHYLWCLAIVGIIGFSFYLLKSSQVFPSASIEIKLSKTQVTQRAEEWAKKLGYSEILPIHSTTFAYDDDGKTFLEYELGSTQANALMKQTIPIWYWTTRFCKPLKQEEFGCWLSPDGHLTAFDRSLENDRELPTVKHDQALTMAQDFVTREAQSSLDGYKLIEQATVEQPHRTDHNFTWEDTVHEWHGAKLRTHVYISGNQVTGYNHYLHVPDVWSRKFGKLRSYNDALADAASIFYVALNTGSFFIFIWAFANNLIRWRFALIVAVVYAVLNTLESLNGLPSQWHSYDTSMPQHGFQLNLAMGIFTGAVQTFVQTFILTAAAESIYRRSFQEKMALEKVLTTIGLRTRTTLNGIVSGTSAFGTHLGWIVLFYLAGRPLGLWCPLEVQNEESLSSYFPFFSALNVGFNASLTEEFTYRVIGLIGFQRLVKNFWVANLLQAAAWAFMHSNYPQEPPYARGVELTVVGFFYGTILRYFGVFPCIFSHNLIDTFLGLEPLFASSIPTMRLSAFLALTPFLALAAGSLILRAKRGEFTDEDSISNKALTPVELPPAVVVAEELAPRTYQYKPMKRPLRLILACMATIFTAIQFLYYVPAIGQSALLTIPRESAIATAKQYLEANDVHLDGYSYSASLVKGLDDSEMQYVFEKAPKRLYELSEIPERPLIWRIRFFKHLVQKEYLVLVDSRGKVLSLGLTEPDDEPGANLTQKEAQEKIETFLNKEHREIVPFTLAAEPREEKKEARTDYTVQFDVPKYKVGEAEYKLTSECIGDRVSGYDHNWILPDKWKFDRDKKYLREEICKVLVYFVYFVFAVALIWWAKGVLRSQAIPWKPAIAIGVVIGIFNMIETVNGLPDLFTEYDTKMPLVSFFVAEGVRTFASATSTIAMYAAIAAFGLGALRLLMPSTSVASVLRTTFLPAGPEEKSVSLNIWLDATIIGFVIGLGQRVLWIALGLLRSHISPTISMAPLEVLCGLVNIFNPSVSTVLDAVTRGMTLVFASAICIGIYFKYLRTARNYFIFALVVSFIFPSPDRYWQDYLIDVVNYLVTFAIIYFLVSKLARENLLAYFLAGFITTIVGSMRVLMKHAAGLYFDDLVFLTALMMSPVMYVIFKRTNRPRFLGGKPKPAAQAKNQALSDLGSF
ncbi:MAG: hypothetical protein U0103_20990 [Candidatus Obscuribacterales bacterium]